MHELITSNEFRRYFKKQLAMMANFIWAKMKSNQFQEAKGALELATKIRNFPKEFNKGDDVQKFVEEVTREFEIAFIRANDDN